jgi:hypothetical protein
MMANAIADRLRRAGFEAQAVHRDMRKGAPARKSSKNKSGVEKLK